MFLPLINYIGNGLHRNECMQLWINIAKLCLSEFCWDSDMSSLLAREYAWKVCLKILQKTPTLLSAQGRPHWEKSKATFYENSSLWLEEFQTKNLNQQKVKTRVKPCFYSNSPVFNSFKNPVKYYKSAGLIVLLPLTSDWIKLNRSGPCNLNHCLRTFLFGMQNLGTDSPEILLKEYLNHR